MGEKGNWLKDSNSSGVWTSRSGNGSAEHVRVGHCCAGGMASIQWDSSTQ